MKQPPSLLLGCSTQGREMGMLQQGPAGICPADSSVNIRLEELGPAGCGEEGNSRLTALSSHQLRHLPSVSWVTRGQEHPWE